MRPVRRKKVPDLTGKNSPETIPRQVFVSCPVGLAYVADGEQVRLNAAAREILAERVGERGERGWTRWIEAVIERLRASGRVREVLPGILEGKRGIEVRLAVEPDSGGCLLALLAADPAAAAGDDLAETVSTLSHELRTPLASMKSSLSLVISGETGPVTADQEHFLGMTMRNIDRLDRLVGDLLDVSRADAGHLNLRPSLLDVAEAVREGVDSHGQAALRAGLALELRGASSEVMARLDSDKLLQILDNLVGNAIKYTPSGGWVEVSLDVFPEEDCLRLEVRDNGPGMDPETRERVLQPFQRSEAATRSLVPGTGLGLSITKRLVEAQGGSLELTSGVGRGTTVRVELPLGRTGETVQAGLQAEPVEI